MPFYNYIHILCTYANTRLLRHVIVDKADLELLVALLCHNFPDLSPLAVDFTEAPDLLCCPCVRDALHVHLDHHAVNTVLSPARFEEFICVEIRKLDDSGRPWSAMDIMNEVAPDIRHWCAPATSIWRAIGKTKKN